MEGENFDEIDKIKIKVDLQPLELTKSELKIVDKLNNSNIMREEAQDDLELFNS